MASNRIDPIAVVAAQVVANDPEIADRMKQLVMKMFDEADRTMRVGGWAEKQAMFKALIPQMLRSMQSADANAGEAAQQAAHDRIMAAMRGDEGSNEQ